LMQDGIFDVLQERIIVRDIQQATADELRDENVPLESIQAELRCALKSKSTEDCTNRDEDGTKKTEDDRGGLILWWKGHSFKTLSALKVRTSI